MTSGQFHSVPLAAISANRDNRQRKVLDDIDIMADSIRRLGLIHPIVITRSGDLVAGERRLAACIKLGHTHINVQYVDELSDATRKEIELEENIKRKNLDWRDECLATLEYAEVRQLASPEISHKDIGEALGLTQQSISSRIAVAREIREGNKQILEAPKFSTAKGIIERANERKNEQSILEIHALNKTIFSSGEQPESILNEDFLQWASIYTGPKFNFIHCDFPYGIGADSFNQGAAPLHGGYTDEEQTYWDLCHCLIHNLDRLCTESCHVMFWFSMHFYQPTIDLFADMADIHFDPFPLLWVKSDNVGILPDPQRGPRRIYETAFFGSRGDRKIVRPTSNAVYLPSDRSQHMSIKPVPVLSQFFKMFVDPTTIMLDPTCGSGSSIRAAESLGASHVLGLEINKDFAEGAQRALKSFRLSRPKDVTIQPPGSEVMGKSDVLVGSTGPVQPGPGSAPVAVGEVEEL